MKEGRFKPRSLMMKTIQLSMRDMQKGRGHCLGEVTLPKSVLERKAQWCVENDKNWQSMLQK